MSPNTTQNVTVNGQTYQVGRFTARQGSWLLAQILTKALPSMLDSSVQAATGGHLAANRPQLTEPEFESLQALCLSVCRRLENGVPMPIFVLPNTWAIKELEYDLIAVVALTAHALVFNIAPFFQGDGLTQLRGVLPTLGLSLSPSPR